MTDHKYSPADKFNQPESDITVVSHASGPRSTLTYFQIEEARRRVAAGENAREVAEEYVRENDTYTST
jgi:hypothetical protein